MMRRIHTQGHTIHAVQHGTTWIAQCFDCPRTAEQTHVRGLSQSVTRDRAIIMLIRNHGTEPRRAVVGIIA